MKKNIFLGLGAATLALAAVGVSAFSSSSFNQPITEVSAKADTNLLKTIRINITLPNWDNLSNVEVASGDVTKISDTQYTADITSTARHNKIKMTFKQGDVTFVYQYDEGWTWYDEGGYLPGYSYTLNNIAWAHDVSASEKQYSCSVSRGAPLTKARVYFEKYNWSQAAAHGWQRVKNISNSNTQDYQITNNWGSDTPLTQIEDVLIDGKGVFAADIPYLSTIDGVATTYYKYYDNSNQNKSDEFNPIEGQYYSFTGQGAALGGDADKGKALDLIMKIKESMGTASTSYGSRTSSICKILDNPTSILADYAALGSAKTVFDNATLNTYVEGVNKDYSTKGAVKFGDIMEYISEESSKAAHVSVIGGNSQTGLAVTIGIAAIGIAAGGTMVFLAKRRKEI